MEANGKKENEITNEAAQEIFYSFLEEEFETKREEIERSEEKYQQAEKVITSVQKGRFDLSARPITYKLKFPVNSISEIKFNTRVKIAKTPFSAKDSQIAQALKMVELYTNTPVVILQELDIFDFARVSALISFFG